MYVRPLTEPMVDYFQLADYPLTGATLPFNNVAEVETLSFGDLWGDVEMPVSVRVNQQLSAERADVGGVGKNAQNAVSRSKTVESYLESVGETLNAMSDLAELAAEPAYDDTDREELDAMFQELAKKLDDYWKNATYGGDSILRGGSYQVGAGDDEQNTQTLSNGNVGRSYLGIESANARTAEAAIAARDALTNAIANVEGQTRTVRAEQDFFQNNENGYAAAEAAVANNLSAAIGEEDAYERLAAIREAALNNIGDAVRTQGANLRKETLMTLDQNAKTATTEAAK